MKTQKYAIIMILVIMTIFTGKALADHKFVKATIIDLSEREFDSLFNALPNKKVLISFDIYNRGGVSNNDLLQYWSRIHKSTDSKETQISFIDAIRTLDDPSLCLVSDEMKMTKATNFFRDICK